MRRRHATQAGMLYGRHSDVFPHPDEGVTVVATSDLATLESRAAELEAALQNLVEQVGKTVGLPPPSHQCPPDHAYSDFAQAINTALALLAKGGTP